MRIVNADGLESFAKQVSGSTSLEANFCILCGEFGANFNNCYRDLVPISTCGFSHAQDTKRGKSAQSRILILQILFTIFG